MWNKDRESRYAITLSPDKLENFDRRRSAWFETPEQVRRAQRWGARKKKLLAWVQVQMEARLTVRERHCIALYYFEDLTYRQIGERTETNASSAYRAVVRGLRKLRQAAAEDESWKKY